MDLSISYKDISRLKPCYDPIKYISREWTGTILEVLKETACPAVDRIWVVSNLLDIKSSDLKSSDFRSQKLFAIFCARQVLSQLADPTPKAATMLDLAELRARSQATDLQLYNARAVLDAVLRSLAGAPVSPDQSTDEAIACSVAYWASDPRGLTYSTASRALTAGGTCMTDNDELRETLSQQQATFLIELLAPPAEAHK